MLRWIFRIVSLVVLLAFVALGVTVLLPADRIAQIAADQIRRATGRDVTITGDVALSIWPVLGAEVGGLEVGNADWAERGPMLTARNAAIGIDARALLSGEIRITHVKAISPTIRLEARSDGRASWQFSDAGGEAAIETETSPDRAPRPLSIARLDITDATLIYAAEGAEPVAYEDVDLRLDWPERTGPARIRAVVRPDGQPVTVTAEIAGFDRFIGGEGQLVDATLDTEAGRATFAGTAAIPGDLSGTLEVVTGNTDGFLRALGLSGAELPPGLGQSLDLGTTIALSAERRLRLSDLRAELGGNTVAGRAEIDLNGVPQVSAALSAGALDLGGLGGGSGGGSGDSGGAGAGTDAAAGWSRAPIDASALAAFDGEITLDADSIALGDVTLGPTRAVVTNERSRMVFGLREVAAYEGTVSGEFVVNNRDGLSVGGSLRGQGLQIQGLLADAADITRLSGAAEAEVSFLGVGASVDAIMRSLRGNGSLRVGQGKIPGIDLDALMRTGQGGGGTTIFDSLTANFSMENGDLWNEDLLMSLRSFEARGAGRVGIGARDIDYLFTPVALKARDGRGVAIPVRIRGSWDDPRVVPDLDAAVRLNLEEERRAVEEDLRSRVEERVEKELGVTVEEGESLEEAIEKKLEDELGRRLRSLFD